MKKVIYQGLYRVLSFLSNHLNNKLIIKYKVLLGTSLLVLMNACQISKKNNSKIAMCYVPVIDDTVKVQDVKLDDPIEVTCYEIVSDLEIELKKNNAVMHDKPLAIDDTVKVQNVKSDEDIILCYMPARDFYIDPEFPGGQSALMKYINDSIRYLEKAKTDGIQGRVIVTFFVNEDGSVSDAEITRRSSNLANCSLLDEEALRVVSSMPQWTPGKSRGKITRIKYTVPVMFRLRD